MKKISVLINLFLTFVFFSCDVVEPDSINNQGSILPLVIGNSWNYQTMQYRYDTADSSISAIDSSFITVSVAKPDTLDSFDGYFIENLFISLGWGKYSIFNNRHDGLYYASRTAFVVPPPPSRTLKLLSYPTFVGDILFLDSLTTIKTTSIDEEVSISDSSYKCVVYEVFSSDKLLGKFWMSPNIGIVKSWQLYFTLHVEHKLLNYELN